MSRYLTALKISEKVADEEPKKPKKPKKPTDEIQKQGYDQPKKPKEPPFASSLGSLGTTYPRFEINQAANDNDKQVDNLASFRWLIHFSDREPVEGTFSPMATHAEVLAHWPGAVAAEPIPERSARTMTDGESAMLSALVSAIYQDDTDDDRNDALQAALADPDNALACYRAVASERGLTLPDSDDRRTCRQCANLRGGACQAATPGGALSAQRGYKPGALWQDEPHRCEAFTERTI